MKIDQGRLWYEVEQHDDFVRLIKKGDVFFDAGSMVGYYGLLAAGHGAKKIVGLEIAKEFSDFANRNFLVNGVDGRSIVCALGDQGKLVHYENALTNSFAVATSLDQLATDLNLDPDVLKVDIEGYEFGAMLGAERLLAKKPRLFLSTHPTFLIHLDHQENELLAFLDRFGYQSVVVRRDDGGLGSFFYE